MKKITMTLLGLVIASTAIYAWNGPSSSAPNNNTASPINISNNSQYKVGGLGVGSLLVDNNAVINGKLGIGTTSPIKELDVHGDINFTGNLYQNGSLVDFNISGSSGNSDGLWKLGSNNSIYYGNGIDGSNFGYYSLATGDKTSVTGNYSFASGYQNIVSGNSSFATGGNNEVSGFYSMVGGYNNNVSDGNSFAIGYNNNVSGGNSFVMGQYNEASGSNSFATGHQTKATGGESFAIGQNTEASGKMSFAMGSHSIASGLLSFAAGASAIAEGRYSFSDGESTKAQSRNSVAFGKYNVGGGDPDNWVNTDPIFEIGIGTSDSDRRNAVTVLKNGNVGIYKTNPSEKLDVDGNIKANSFIENSDIRLKKNISTINNALSKIEKLRGVDFNWKSNGEKEIGFIAQEVEKILPELVVTSKTDGMKGVKYGNVTALLVEAVKELEKEKDEEIDKLRKENKEQEDEIKELRREIEELKKMIEKLRK